jgi:hypothetical protein
MGDQEAEDAIVWLEKRDVFIRRNNEPYPMS